MAYTPTTWQEGITTLGPTNMNHLESGVQAAASVADAAVAKPATPATNDGLIWNGSTWVNQKIANATIDPAAAIAYSKLSLAGSVVNNDIATAAAIAASKLAGYPTDGTKVLKGDGTWGAAGPIQTISATPPGSPSNGDIWIFPADDANGVYWAFIFDSAETTYKWRFTGGPPMTSQVDTLETSTSASYVALATAGPTIALTRDGDYIVSHGFDVGSGGTGEQALMSYDIGATGAVDGDAVHAQQVTQLISLARTRRKNAIGASKTLTAKYKLSSTASLGFENRWMAVIPVRVI